jgi:hypothetical protein
MNFLHEADVQIWQGYWVYFLELSLGMHQQYAGLEAVLSNAPAICRGWGSAVNHKHVQHIALQCANNFLRRKFTKHSFAEAITIIHQKS